MKKIQFSIRRDRRAYFSNFDDPIVDLQRLHALIMPVLSDIVVNLNLQDRSANVEK